MTAPYTQQNYRDWKERFQQTSAVGGLLREAKTATGMQDPAPLLAPTPPFSPEAPGSPDAMAAPDAAPQDAHDHRKGLRGGLLHLIGADRIAPEVGALLTPDQQERAKPGLLASVGNAVLRGKTPAEVQQERAANMLALGDTKRTRDLTAQQEATARRIEAVAATMEPQAGVQYAARMKGIYGLPSAQAAIGAAVGLKPREFAAMRPITKNTEQGIMQYNVDLEQWEPMLDGNGRPMMAPPPQAAPSYSPVAGGETANGTVPIINTRTGQVTDSGIPVKESAGVGSAINMAARARFTAAVSEMDNADKGMQEFEAGLANGTITIGASAQVLGRVANAFTHDNPASQLMQSTALAALNRTDPQLARYIRRGLSFAEGESMISQRPSDFRTKMAAFLSTAASGASPEMIADINGRRKSIMTPLNAILASENARQGTGVAAPTPAGAPARPQKSLTDRIAELKAEGKSKDEARAILLREGYTP